MSRSPVRLESAARADAYGKGGKIEVRGIIVILGLLLAASLSAQQQDAGKDASASQGKGLALPETERDLTNTDQNVSVVFGSIVLVAAVAAAPFVISHGGETRIGPFPTPYWTIDAAGALIAIAALNYTFNEIYHIDTDRSLISIFGVPIGKF